MSDTKIKITQVPGDPGAAIVTGGRYAYELRHGELSVLTMHPRTGTADAELRKERA